MKKFAKTAVLLIIGLVILVFALANRQVVVFSLDPLGSLDPASPLVFQMPLFALAVILVMDGSLHDAQGRQSQLDIERSGRASVAQRAPKA